MNLFTRARLNLALTPGERSLLKTLATLGCAALSAIFAGPTAAAIASNLGHSNLTGAAQVAGTALLTSVLAGLMKYASALGDSQAGQAADLATIKVAPPATTLPTPITPPDGKNSPVTFQPAGVNPQ